MLEDRIIECVMVFDEFDIHPKTETERGIHDCDKTCFPTKYYCI